jgi:hypothetical protein
MQEWQYNVIHLEGDVEAVNKELNNAGFQGLELVTVSTLSVTTGANMTGIAIFKRPLNL